MWAVLEMEENRPDSPPEPLSRQNKPHEDLYFNPVD